MQKSLFTYRMTGNESLAWRVLRCQSQILPLMLYDENPERALQSTEISVK